MVSCLASVAFVSLTIVMTVKLIFYGAEAVVYRSLLAVGHHGRIEVRWED